MKHHRKLLVALVVALAAAAYFGWPWPNGPAHRITPYTVLKVRVGMTRQEVEAVFGVPPGDYFTLPEPTRTQARAGRRPDLQREDWRGGPARSSTSGQTGTSPTGKSG